MDLMQLISHPFSIGRGLATKKIIKQFTHKFDLVYFGYVNQREDDHELIRGITVAANHTDNHFSVGHFHGHDISLVERQNTLTFPDKQPQQYRWIIMQIDLRRSELPHIFIDAHHHDEMFYANLFVKFANLAHADSLFAESDPLFARYFNVFTPADKFDDAELLLSKEVTAMLAHHFRQFDYELGGDRLLVYASNPVVSLHLLQEMLRIGTWLADQFNAVELP
jgi:hypothetical protein